MIVANTLLNAPTVPTVDRGSLAPVMGCTAIVQRPRYARLFAWFLLVAFIGLLVGLIFLPWQQTVIGRGQVTAYKPSERQQPVVAPISGLIKSWHVVEGSTVKAGDLLVELADPDPQLEQRLQQQKTFLQGRHAQFAEQIARRKAVLEELNKSRDAQLKVAAQGVSIATQTVEQRKRLVGTTNERYELARKEFALFERAVDQGLRPEIDVIRQRTLVNTAKLEAERATAELKAAEESLVQAEANIGRVQADATRLINESLQAIEQLTGDQFIVDRDLQQIETQLARFATRFVKAPQSGTVFRIPENAAQVGGQVKEGSPLAVIVPDSDEYVVELFIDGVDAPLIQRGPDGRYPHVRLQFEGWPAVQFTGWPSAAYGTFGGRVRQIDRTDNGAGQFRVLIEPDAMFDNDTWPAPEYLRQGNQAVGWVFLQRVTLGWEFWRRLNGFPPVVAQDNPDKKDKPAKSGK